MSEEKKERKYPERAVLDPKVAMEQMRCVYAGPPINPATQVAPPDPRMTIVTPPDPEWYKQASPATMMVYAGPEAMSRGAGFAANSFAANTANGLPTVITCPSCGFQNNGTAKFCVECGVNLPKKSEQN